MQGKKRYLALVLFLLLGLVTFSFANPDEQLEPVEGNVKKVEDHKGEKKIQTKFDKAEELVERAEQNPTEEIIAEAEEAIETAASLFGHFHVHSSYHRSVLCAESTIY